MYTGNQTQEAKNLSKLLEDTSDSPIVGNKPRPNVPGGPLVEEWQKNPYKSHEQSSWFNPTGYATDYYSNLNNAGGYGGGMQDVSVPKGAGGTGGGSEDTMGNMDANQLLELNPYLSKNVTSFGHGGMFGEFARQYDNGGVIPQPQQQVMQQPQPQVMPQQTESYAKQATDMIALAQLEAFGKKFASQLPQGQLPQANNGMKMRKYTQGGRF